MPELVFSPSRTLHQMAVAVVNYLNINRIPWKLVECVDSDFHDVPTVLDNAIKEQTTQSNGMGHKQAALIPYEMKNKLSD